MNNRFIKNGVLIQERLNAYYNLLDSFNSLNIRNIDSYVAYVEECKKNLDSIGYPSFKKMIHDGIQLILKKESVYENDIIIHKDLINHFVSSVLGLYTKINHYVEIKVDMVISAYKVFELAVEDIANIIVNNLSLSKEQAEVRIKDIKHYLIEYIKEENITPIFIYNKDKNVLELAYISDKHLQFSKKLIKLNLN